MLISFLTACGGGGNDGIHPENQFFEKFKGSEQEPALTDISGKIVNDILPLNSILNDSIKFHGSKNWSFTANKTGSFILQIVTSDNLGKFSIYGPAVDQSQSIAEAQNPIIFDAVQDQTYSIDFSWNSWRSADSEPTDESTQTFKLKLVEVNRASLKLAEDEYAYQLNIKAIDSCNSEGEQEDTESNNYEVGIINPTSVYIDSPSRHKRFSYIIQAMGSYEPVTNFV